MGIFHIIIFFGILLTFEFKHRKYLKSPQSSDPKKSDDSLGPYVLQIDSAEFSKLITAGRELVLLDDLVLDVSVFKSEHPGSKFILDSCLGQDISRYFYGGYALAGDPAPSYAHSKLAYDLAHTLIYARLLGCGSEKSNDLMQIRIVDKQPINSKTSLFVMK